MVKFGDYTFLRSKTTKRGKNLAIIKKDTPSFSISIVENAGGKNRMFGTTGEIRWTTSLLTDQNDILDLKDGATRTLDLEDGSSTVEAVMKDYRYGRDVNHPKTIFYAVTFAEIDNP